MVPIVYPVLHALIFLIFRPFDGQLARHLVEAKQTRSLALEKRCQGSGLDEDSLSFIDHADFINGPRYDGHSF